MLTQRLCLAQDKVYEDCLVFKDLTQGGAHVSLHCPMEAAVQTAE